ncbi:MAG TPA: alpha/beta hydrolase [Gemmatimonadales bacterium]|nr:alpha/beta hydrolase [Gemmatimonadales bacterium]
MVGNGPQTLVLAADPPVVIEQYDELFQCLEKSFRVIVFEVPGFGFSMPSSGFRFDFRQLNDLVAEFLRQLGLAPYILAFPCVAAYGAVDIAKRFPELISGVVLIQAPSWTEEVKWKHGRDRQGLLSTPIIGQLALQILKRRRAPKWFDAAVGKREMLSQFVATTDDAFSHGACFCLASAFQRYLTDAPQPLSVINQPSLVIWGEADKSHRHTDKSSSKLYCPSAKNLRFKRAGHFPELEEPELFAHEVKHWALAIKA